MKVREMIKCLVENQGWYLVRICGCHRQFKLRRKKNRVTINCKMDKELPDSALSYSINYPLESVRVTVRDQYSITIEQSENCYSAYCPDLPGCVAVGDTVEETKELMMGAVKLHLEGLKQDGVLALQGEEPDTQFELKQAS